LNAAASVDDNISVDSGTRLSSTVHYYLYPPPIGWALCSDGRCLSVCLLPDPKSRTGGHRELKIGRKEAHDTRDLWPILQDKRSRSPGRLTPWPRISYIYGTGRKAYERQTW